MTGTIARIVLTYNATINDVSAMVDALGEEFETDVSLDAGKIIIKRKEDDSNGKDNCSKDEGR